MIGNLSYMQVAILIATCTQNTGYVLLRRFSQGVLREKASPAAILLVGEIMKLVTSMAMIVRDPENSGVQRDLTWRGKFAWWGRTSKVMLVPASVYLTMNMLSFVALARIDAGLFTILAQAKILTTALFGRVMLGKELHERKWRALILVALGAMLITNQRAPAKVGNVDSYDFYVGTAAALLEITLSGAVTVYFERVLKGTTTPHTVWDRNIQLAAMSGLTFVPIALMETRGQFIFADFGLVTFLVSFLGALGGILVALCVRYTDSVMKCLATCASIVLTTSLSSLLLGATVDFVIAVGSTIVVVSILNYFDEGGVLEPKAPPEGRGAAPQSALADLEAAKKQGSELHDDGKDQN
mmetsp:Transcript_19849/g.49655  ORF Transcript_19849/g.49655 Transcript_19849/m.49655 type:complete len:355 (+) Transcript_19849:159-1223(+)